MKATALMALIVASGCACGVVGCGGGQRMDGAGAQDDIAQRMARAVRLAEQGDRAEDPARALAYYDQAIGEYEELAQAWNGRGVALMSLDRYLEAAESFRRAGDLWPDDPRPLYNLGLAYYNRRYFDVAREQFVEAIRRSPNHLPSLRAAIECDRVLSGGDEATLDWIERVLMSDVNPEERDDLTLFRLKVQKRLADEKRALAG
ncbi:MAG: tetratricopeptide repeat protein [Phycisphaeraceae bacterium]|nr:tetratricopeptide repeat protein [Phycisphaerales bacterium]MCB9842612.1 tetratricopeptide repeat protein [Phycisphaeraceae bacterium]